MALTILAVDASAEASEREQEAWRRHGFDTVRADTMQEAIERLSKRAFSLVCINADNINYLPLLQTMSDISTAHIFIADSRFTLDKQNEAYTNGATGYAPFQDDPEQNVLSALAYLKSIDGRGRTVKRTPHIVTCGNLTIIAEHIKVFCNDKEIIFSHKERMVFFLLFHNRNITLTFRQIAGKVWGAEAVSNEAISQMITKIRKKLTDARFDGGDIVNHRSTGYRFTTEQH